MEYGRFGVLSQVDLERFFYLDDADRKLIAERRRNSNRLGFALQLVTVRYLGMFLPDPLDVPAEVVAYLAEQLDIADPTCVKSYTERKQTRYDHQDEIVRADGLTEFAQVEGELVAWIADQAWMTGDGPKALTAGAVRWLRERSALLPGVTTLERLVSEGKQAADQRLWTHLASQLTGREAGILLGLLETREEGRRKVVELERLRKGVFTPSTTGMKHALARVRDLNAVVPAAVDITEVPPRRLIALAAHGITGKTSHLRRMRSQRERLLALLTATAHTLRSKAVDDVLELFDLLMVTDLMAKAERQSKDEKLRRYPRVTRNAGKLARAVRVLLEMSEADPQLSLELVWDLIENTVSKSELRAALAAIDELVPQADPEFDEQRLEGAGRPIRHGPLIPARDDAHHRLRRHRRRRAGPQGYAHPGRADLPATEPWAPGPLARCPPCRSRPGERRLAATGVPRGAAGGDGGSGRVHTVCARTVPSASALPQHFRRGFLEMA